jgi:predicted outer membrane repeat protein
MRACAVICVGLTLCVAASAQIHVDQTAAGAGDGSSWTDAYTDLEPALQDAVVSGEDVWVAEGEYRPSNVLDAGDARSATFLIAQDGIRLFGGFPSGGGDGSFQARDWRSFSTVLSGDFAGDDDPGDETTFVENAYHVILVDGSTERITDATVIDGFTITGGNANGPFPRDDGGGINCDGGSGGECSPLLRNLLVIGNRAEFNGGGLHIRSWKSGGESSPRVVDVEFRQNFAARGGAIYNRSRDGSSSNGRFENVRIIDNRAVGGAALQNGGEGQNSESSTSFVNVLMQKNVAEFGGAISNFAQNGAISRPTFTNSIITGNWANENNGGAIYNAGSNGGDINAAGGIASPVLVNVLLSGNRARFFGGAVYNTSGEAGTASPVFVNTTFTGNVAESRGGALYTRIDAPSVNEPDFSNAILWLNESGSGAQIHHRDDANAKFSTSLIEASGGSGAQWDTALGVDNGGNIDSDPLFLSGIAAANAPTSAGDFRLGSASPAIDAGASGVNPTGLDLRGNARSIRSIDLGAYEYGTIFRADFSDPRVTDRR